MSEAINDPQEDPIPDDELARLEERHLRWKEKQEAWRRMLERLDELIKKNTENIEPKKPTS